MICCCDQETDEDINEDESVSTFPETVSPVHIVPETPFLKNNMRQPVSMMTPIDEGVLI